MIHFSCPHCHKRLKGDNSPCQRRIRCPECQELFEVPKSVGHLVPLDTITDLGDHLPSPEDNAAVRVELGPLFPTDGEKLEGHYPVMVTSEGNYESRRNNISLFMVSLMSGALILGIPLVILLIKSKPEQQPQAKLQPTPPKIPKDETPQPRRSPGGENPPKENPKGAPGKHDKLDELLDGIAFIRDYPKTVKSAPR